MGTYNAPYAFRGVILEKRKVKSETVSLCVFKRISATFRGTDHWVGLKSIFHVREPCVQLSDALGGGGREPNLPYTLCVHTTLWVLTRTENQCNCLSLLRCIRVYSGAGHANPRVVDSQREFTVPLPQAGGAAIKRFTTDPRDITPCRERHGRRHCRVVDLTSKLQNPRFHCMWVCNPCVAVPYFWFTEFCW